MQSPRSVDRFEYFPFVPFFQRISNLGIGNIHVYSIKKIIHRRNTQDFYGSVHVYIRAAAASSIFLKLHVIC